MMKELLSILILGSIATFLPILIAFVFKIKPSKNRSSYEDGYFDGFIDSFNFGCNDD